MRHLTVQVDGTPLHVTTTGQGSPLLIVGGAVPSEWADHLALELAPFRRVINFDYRAEPGWNGTPIAKTQLALAEDAIRLLDELDIPTTDLLGYSRGAVAAYAAALHHSDRIASLILLAPVAPFEDLLLVDTAAPTPSTKADLLDALTRLAFSPEYVERHLEQARHITQMVVTDHAHVVRVPRCEEQPIPDDQLVSQATLIISAGADNMVDQQHAERLAALLPRADLQSVAGGSHLVAYERPVEIARMMESFLAAVTHGR